MKREPGTVPIASHSTTWERGGRKSIGETIVMIKQARKESAMTLAIHVRQSL